MGKTLTSMKIEPWILAGLDLVREKDPEIDGERAPYLYPNRVKKVTTRTWVVEKLLTEFLKERGLTSESPEVIDLLRQRFVKELMEERNG